MLMDINKKVVLNLTGFDYYTSLDLYQSDNNVKISAKYTLERNMAAPVINRVRTT